MSTTARVHRTENLRGERYNVQRTLEICRRSPLNIQMSTDQHMQGNYLRVEKGGGEKIKANSAQQSHRVGNTPALIRQT